MEIYTCCFGEEVKEKDRKLSMTIDPKTFQLGGDFELEELLYIVMRK
jgi:hypothetical protein